GWRPGDAHRVENAPHLASSRDHGELEPVLSRPDLEFEDQADAVRINGDDFPEGEDHLLDLALEQLVDLAVQGLLATEVELSGDRDSSHRSNPLDVYCVRIRDEPLRLRTVCHRQSPLAKCIRPARIVGTDRPYVKRSVAGKE